MITKENLKQIYEDTIEKKELTIGRLNSYGLTENDLRVLVQEGTIEEGKNKTYLLKDVDKLYQYGSSVLVNEKRYIKAKLCFERCLELNSNHVDSYFQLLIDSTCNKDYQRVIQLLEKLSQMKIDHYQFDSQYYWYLLSMVTKIPEKYGDSIKGINISEIRIRQDDKRYQNIPLRNRIRIAALSKKFPFSLRLMKELNQIQGKLTPQDILESNLLNEAANADNKSKHKIISLLKEKRYDELMEYLISEQEQYPFNANRKMLLDLVKEYKKIEATKQVPQELEAKNNTMLCAIDAKKYKKALELSNAHLEKYHLDRNVAINLMLRDLCNLINQIQRTQLIEMNQGLENLLLSIHSSLMNQEIENALQKVSTYMNLIGKKEYEFLIVNFIKIGVLEKDTSFTKVMDVLAVIDKKDYVFPLATYVKEFYMNLSENKLEEAIVYLDIIKKGNGLGQESIMINDLEKALELSKTRRFNAVRQEEERNAWGLKQTHDRLVQKHGIVLLDTMDLSTMEIMLNDAKQYSDIDAFIIGEENKRIVFRYKKCSVECLNPKKLIKEAQEASRQKDYEKALEKNLILLYSLEKPKYFIYGNVGSKYFQLGDYVNALDYLIVAKELSKQEVVVDNYMRVIQNQIDTIINPKMKEKRLQEWISNPYFKMDRWDLSDIDIKRQFRLTNFEEVNTYVKESGLDVESACRNLGMKEEPIDIIKLIYAREYYKQGAKDQGDLFLKSVPIRRSTPQMIVTLYEEIQRNKRFYSYYEEEAPVQLKLSLKPNKK